MSSQQMIPQCTQEWFWSRVEKQSELTRGCWLWRGRMHGGRGVFTLAGREVRAHRFAWLLQYGPLDPRVLLFPACGEARCVRPEHQADFPFQREPEREAADLSESEQAMVLVRNHVLQEPARKLARLFGATSAAIKSLLSDAA